MKLEFVAYAFHPLFDGDGAEEFAQALEEGVQHDLVDGTQEVRHAPHLDRVRTLQRRVDPHVRARHERFNRFKNTISTKK